MTRREFVRVTVATGLAVGTGSTAWAVEARNEMPYRVLGRTGERISALGLGGFHVGGQRDEQDSIRIIRSAIDRGVNFMDNCWDYHGGNSEIRMGKALRDGYRAKVLLMTKIDGRTKAAAARQIDESLRRLQVDHVDLMQFHEIIRREDPDRIFGPGGAMEAMAAAKQAGKVRYIGFTGHKDPSIHLRMLEVAAGHKFRFDAVQMPLNVMDAHFRSFEREVLPVLMKDDIGVLAMKTMAGGGILRSNTVTAAECLQYALNLRTSTAIVGMDSMRYLDQAIDTARAFKPLTAEQVTALLARTAAAAAGGQYEIFKISPSYDATTRFPEWTG
jgi:predicted aldo/keto reductase-like oxidoreductase